MQYWGKFWGLILGLISGAGFFGAVIGLFIGHLFDKKWLQQKRGAGFHTQQRQGIFFSGTFQILGHIAKAKGRVTVDDIQLATTLMDRMQLHGNARVAAQQAFREGKKADFPLRNTLRQIKFACFGRRDLIQMFLEIQFQAALADGVLHPNERDVLLIIADELGIPLQQFDQFLRMSQGESRFEGRSSYSSANTERNRPTLSDACQVLGVNVHDDPTVVKRAYRKLMNEHHPDKLVAKGLPPEMIELAKQKTQSIQSAYDLIKKEQGFK